MKSPFLICFLLLIGQSMVAQDLPPHVLGLRLGDADGFGAEISYQGALGQSNRVELDLGWRNASNWDGFKLTGLYQWVNHLDGSFNWYYGFGGGLGSLNYSPGVVASGNGGLFVYGAGIIGIEYRFEIPLQISLDFRPEIGLLGYDDVLNNPEIDLGFGIRYIF
ncbi:hypothetical protein N9L94_00305 [Robiginitalea sp.]|nr:hypothetical protein [Robiginitalea sp.]